MDGSAGGEAGQAPARRVHTKGGSDDENGGDGMGVAVCVCACV
jgi:hypothetical protein